MHTETNLQLSCITHNIRYAATDLLRGEAPWLTRLPLLAAHFHYHTTNNVNSFLCLQEVLSTQLDDLLTRLNTDAFASTPAPLSKNDVRPTWSFIGVGRDDGQSAGEYAPILYHSKVWELLYHDTFWLSETPTVPGSKGWDAASVRICTTGLFRHHDSRKEVVLFNTHLDDQGAVARKEAAKIIRTKVETWISKGKVVILAGDLNSTPENPAYKFLTADNSPLMDMRICAQANRDQIYGDVMTFTGFEGKAEDKQRLDYLFVGPKHRSAEITPKNMFIDEMPWNVFAYAVLPNKFDSGIYHSDHRAVAAVVNIS